MGSPSSYGWASHLVVQLAEQDHANIGFCWQADAPTRHFICLVLRGWESQGEDYVALRRLASDVHSQPRRSLVQRFWDMDVGSGFMPFLARLGRRTMSRAGYDALGTILGDPARRRLAIRQPSLSAANLRTLSRYDTGLIEVVGMEALCGLGEGILEQAVRAVLARRTDLNRSQVLRRLHGLTDQQELSKALLAFFADCHLSVPWSGVERIRPLRSTAAMAQVAKRFRNCLGNPAMHWQALRGDTIFYMCDDGPAVAELRRDRVAKQWCLHQLLGPRNRPPSRRVQNRIIAAFAAAGLQQINVNRLPWADTDSWL